MEENKVPAALTSPWGPPRGPRALAAPLGATVWFPAQELTSFCLEEWNPTVCPSLSNDARGVFARGRKRPGLSFTKGEPCVRAEPSVHRGRRADRCHEQEWRPVTTHGGRSLPVGLPQPRWNPFRCELRGDTLRVAGQIQKLGIRSRLRDPGLHGCFFLTMAVSPSYSQSRTALTPVKSASWKCYLEID